MFDIVVHIVSDVLAAAYLTNMEHRVPVFVLE